MPSPEDETATNSISHTDIDDYTDYPGEEVPETQQFFNEFGTDTSGGLTLHQVRERTKGAIRYCIDNGVDGVIDAPPSAGKSHGAVKVIAEMGMESCYFTARRDLYEQIKQWCEAEGLRVKILPSMPHECQNYTRGSGAYNLYNRGMRPSQIHSETGACSKDCSYMQESPTLTKDELRKQIPLDYYDVLIGHPKHSFVEPYTRNRVVFFDDISKSAFIEEFEVSKALINAILEDDEFHFDTVEEIYEARGNEISQSIASVELDSLSFNPWSDPKNTTHADALKIVRTIVEAENLSNGVGRFHYVPSDQDDGQEYIGVKDGDHNVYLLKRPPLRNSAETVITLNAYPVVHKLTPTWINWRLGIGAELVSPLSLEERQEYISDVLNISVIQASEYIKPYSSGKYVSVNKDSKLIKYVAKKHDTDIPVITANRAISRFEDRDLPVDEFLNFASVESSNVFGDRRVGIVLGSPEWQLHHNVKLIGAFMDEAVEWNEEKGVNKSFGEFGDPIMHAFREHMVGQAILRFGRNSQGATVYVHTSAIPDDIPIESKFDEELGNSYTSLGHQILEVMKSTDQNPLTTGQIQERVEGHDKAITRKLSQIDSVERVQESQGNKPAKWALLN